MGKSDITGSRGESIAFMRLTPNCRDDGSSYFLPHFLGEKCPLFDYLVELVDAGANTPFFFVQVKCTGKPYTKSQTPPRLRHTVSARDVQRLAAYPAPTYVVGVHEKEERAFIISVHGGMCEAIHSITTDYELTPDTLKCLWDEVREFWQDRDMARHVSRFLN